MRGASHRAAGPPRASRAVLLLLVVTVVLGVATTSGAQVQPPDPPTPAVWATSCVSPGAGELVVYGRGFAAGAVELQVRDQAGAVVGTASVTAAERQTIGAVFQGRVAVAVPADASDLLVVATQPGLEEQHSLSVRRSCSPTITGVSAAPCALAGRPVDITVTVRGAPTTTFDRVVHHVDLYGPAETVDLATQPPRPAGDYAFPITVANVPERIVPVTVEARRTDGSLTYATTRVGLPPACSQPTTAPTSATTAPATTGPAGATTTVARPGATTTSFPPIGPFQPRPDAGGPSSGGMALTLSPTLGRAGEAATVSGRGFAPSATVTLRWRPGIGAWTVTAGGDGSFRTQVLVLPNDVEGPRVLEATGAPPVRYLVVPGSEQPAFGGVFVRG